MNESSSGFGRLGCVLILLSVAMIWGGGQGVYTWLTNREPVVTECGDYLETKPKAKWLRLTGCEVDLLGAAYKRTLGGRVTEIFIPVRPPGEDAGAPVHVLLSTRDRATRSLLSRIAEIEDQKELLRFMVENREALRQTRDVEGLVRFGIEMKSEDRRKLARLDDSLVKDFVVLGEGEKPGIGDSLAFFALGLLTGTGALVSVAVSARARKD